MLYCFIQDPIVIYVGDLARLADGAYLNDALIDLVIRRFVMESLGDAKESKVHAFSCLLYTKLGEESRPDRAHALVARWTKNIDVFALDFMLVPVNHANHWSLLVVIRPGILARNLALMVANGQYTKENSSRRERSDEASIDDPDESGNRCCMIHLDSLGIHDTAKFSNRIKQ